MEVARDVPHVPANSERMSGKRARTEDVASSTELNRGDRVLFQDKKSLWYEGVLGSKALNKRHHWWMLRVNGPASGQLPHLPTRVCDARC